MKWSDPAFLNQYEKSVELLSVNQAILMDGNEEVSA